MQQGDENPSEEPEEERSILHIGGAQAIFTENFPPQVQYVALGHLHRYQTVSPKPCPVVYSSSPLAYSFAEANQTKNVVIIEAEPGQPVVYRPVALTKGKKLLRAKFEVIEEAMQWLAQNVEALVQITIVADSFLASADKKRLMESHEGLMPIIPEIRSQKDSEQSQQKVADLQTQSMEELFVDYFQNKNGQTPNDSLMALFKEILSTEEI